MSRKSIFEINAKKYDLGDEVMKSEKFFAEDNNFLFDYGHGQMPITGQAYINSLVFEKWKYRDTAITLEEFREKKGVSRQVLEREWVDLELFLIYAELILNMLALIFKYNYGTGTREKRNTAKAKVLMDNFKILLAHLNFKIHMVDDKDINVIVVEDKPEATAVADMIEDEDISLDVIRYNHFMLKGDLHEKKKILTQFYKEYERIKPILKRYNKTLSSDLGEMFNALGIRHLKADNKITNELVSKMQPEEVEAWCDNTYDVFLHAMLTVNYLEMKKNIAWLKTGDDDGNND